MRIFNVRCNLPGVQRNHKKIPLKAYSQAKSEYDHLERVFSALDVDGTDDPYRSVASALDLRDYLKQQARISLSGRWLRIANYLIDSLDDDGYFREPLFDDS